jgi:ABC-type amino acid transport substrate-binding protein
MRKQLSAEVLTFCLGVSLAFAPLHSHAEPTIRGDSWGHRYRKCPVDTDGILRPPAIDTLAALRQRGTLRVGVVPVAPMVMLAARGELVGYSVDLARRMAQDLGVDVEFVPTTWAESRQGCWLATTTSSPPASGPPCEGPWW